MKRPPMLMHMRYHTKEHNFGLWLPLFLLGPILLAILIVLSPLIMITLLILWPSGWGKWALVTLWASIVSLCSLRGFEVDVQNEDQCVYISVK